MPIITEKFRISINYTIEDITELYYKNFEDSDSGHPVPQFEIEAWFAEIVEQALMEIEDKQ